MYERPEAEKKNWLIPTAFHRNAADKGLKLPNFRHTLEMGFRTR
jgi:hypothetical protein